ncbi:HAD family hydrolase [Mucilaginibacter daejeonensis]|uniref:HAD family hydrolase n=1 Tax=Mucilaginibacter daejeonensis TaxID=398049 RepID=UPI001D17B986|nr:HAD family hydrolase [Mucilaginibacter daejeonensis]UEG54576.1 HAD family hydrolase [Mucilaginibacter daejeonensis]
MKNVKVIAFDADDTLWVNEPYFRRAEERFCNMFSDFMSVHDVERELFKTEIDNLKLYGYGIKGFVLSLIETALRITDHRIDVSAIDKILEIGKEMLNEPIELLDGVEEVLQALQGHYRLVVATKGDLLDQERKLKRSGLAKYFHHIEIMSEKDEAAYSKLVKHLDIHPDELLMIGNTLRSDVLPVLAIGGHAIHIPYHITWIHETVEHQVEHPNFISAVHVKDVLPHLLP